MPSPPAGAAQPHRFPSPALVVTDLDGTLWDSSELAHQRTLRALRALQEHQVPVLVATGRTLNSARQLLARNSLQLPIIGLDGALGQDFAGEHTFHRASFDPQAALSVLRLFESARLQPVLHVDSPPVDTVISPDAELPGEQESFYLPTLRRAPLDDAIAEEPVYQFVSYGPDATLRRLATAAAEHGNCVIIRNALFGGPALTVSPPGASKWLGTERYCQLRHLDPGRVLAVGNGENDLDLLSRASIACVVRDGAPEALALADHVIDPADQGGWAEVLDLVWPGGRP